MTQRKSARQVVPPFKVVKNLRGTRREEEVGQGGQIRRSGPGAVNDGLANSARFSVRASTDVRGVNYVTVKDHLGKTETIKDLEATPPRHRQGERVVNDHPLQIKYSGKPCQYYERTGRCDYGARCIHYHRPGVRAPDLTSEHYPIRKDKPTCPHYLQKGWCGFGATCKFNHPEPVIVHETAYSVFDASNLGGNTTPRYTLYPVPLPMPSQGWYPPPSMPLQMPCMSHTPFHTAPFNVGCMPCFYAYPQITRVGYWTPQEGHLMPTLPRAFESGSSVEVDSYREELEPTKDSLKEDDPSEYDEN